MVKATIEYSNVEKAEKAKEFISTQIKNSKDFIEGSVALYCTENVVRIIVLKDGIQIPDIIIPTEIQ